MVSIERICGSALRPAPGAEATCAFIGALGQSVRGPREIVRSETPYRSRAND